MFTFVFIFVLILTFKLHRLLRNQLTRCVRVHQPKQLRRLIQQTFQGYSNLTEDQCMSRFFSTLAHCQSYTQESFACQLSVSVSGSDEREEKKKPLTTLTLTSALYRTDWGLSILSVTDCWVRSLLITLEWFLCLYVFMCHCCVCIFRHKWIVLYDFDIYDKYWPPSLHFIFVFVCVLVCMCGCVGLNLCVSCV